MTYYGDVEVVVRMRYRVSAEFHSEDPPVSEMFDCLQQHTYDDISDTEELEIMEVISVGPNEFDDSDAGDDDFSDEDEL